MEKSEVFILNTEYVKNGEKKTEINGVYSSKEKAEKTGKWLINSDEFNGIKYVKYNINNFIVL